MSPDDEPDLVVRQGRIGDRYVIASDGLTDYVARDTIEEVLTTTDDPGECADQLVALALRAGAPDNVTVVVGDLVDISRRPAPPTQPQVVGAAAVRETGTRPIPTTPAAKAAALTRAATGRHRRRRPHPRRGGSALARAARPCAWRRCSSSPRSSSPAARTPRTRGRSSSTTSPTQDGVVTVFRGVDQTLGPVSLSSPAYSTTIAVDDLPASYQDSLRAGIEVDDRAAADARVGELRVQAAGVPLGPGPRRGVPHGAVHLDRHPRRRPRPPPPRAPTRRPHADADPHPAAVVRAARPRPAAR